MQKFYRKITMAGVVQPFQYDFRRSAAKDIRIKVTHAAVAPSNLDAATNYNAICRHCIEKTQYNNAHEHNISELQNRVSTVSTPKPQKARF